MDAEMLKAVTDVAENVTTIAVLICWISCLIRENSILRRILFGYLLESDAIKEMETQAGI